MKTYQQALHRAFDIIITVTDSLTIIIIMKSRTTLLHMLAGSPRYQGVHCPASR